MEPLGYRARNQDFALPQKKQGLNILWRDRKNFNIDYLVTCHTDYCAGTGAVDNASGAGVMASVASMCKEEEIGNVAFMAFDGEEQGLKGSKAFIDAYFQDVRRHDPLILNVDSIGAGRLVQLRSSLRRKKEIILPIDQWESSQHRTDADSFLGVGFPAATISSYDAFRKTIASVCFCGEETPELVKALESFSIGNVCNTEEDTVRELDEKNMDAASDVIMNILYSSRANLTFLERG